MEGKSLLGSLPTGMYICACGEVQASGLTALFIQRLSNMYARTPRRGWSTVHVNFEGFWIIAAAEEPSLGTPYFDKRLNEVHTYVPGILADKELFGPGID